MERMDRDLLGKEVVLMAGVTCVPDAGDSMAKA